MKPQVRPQDRKNEVEYLRMALNLCEIGVSYTQADLIIRVMAKVNEVKGNFTLMDGATILKNWNQDWEYYYRQLEKNILAESIAQTKEKPEEDANKNV